MSAVGSEVVSHVLAVALDPHVVHEVAPLLLKQVLAPLDPVVEEVSRPRREVLRVVVARAVKVQGDVSVDPHRKVVVKHLHRLREIGTIRDQQFSPSLAQTFSKSATLQQDFQC